jgi:hypothetical protein
MQLALLYIVITVLMSAVIIAFGLPFLVAGWLFARFTRGAIAAGPRIALAAAVAALGIAPNYDAYRGPLPIYMRLVRGEPAPFVASAVSLVITWLVLLAIARFFARRRVTVA